MIKETIKMTGKVRLVLRDKDGNIKQDEIIKNLIVTAGLNFICSRMDGTGSSIMSHCGVGSGSTSAAVGNTDLGTSINRTAHDSSTVSGTTIQYITTFPAGTGTGALTEAGIFNASSSGTMLCRVVFSVINKAAADSLLITWSVTIS